MTSAILGYCGNRCKWSGRLFRGNRAGSAEMFHRTIHYRLHFPSVFYLAALGENLSGFFGSVPGGIAHGLVRLLGVLDFQEKSLHHKLTNAGLFPEHTFRMNVKVEVTRLDVSADACFFQGFALGCLAM